MRILIVLHQFFPEFAGGTERVALNLARMAQRAGHHVHVLAATVEPERCGGVAAAAPFKGCLRASHEGVPVTFIPRSMLPGSADIGLETGEAVVASLARWMDDERFDVAHVMHTMRMGSAVLAAQRSGLPYVLTLTDFFLPCAQVNLITVAGQACDGPQQGNRCARECAVPPWTPVGLRQRYGQAASIVAAAADRVAPSEYVAQRYRDIFPGLQVRVIPHGIDLVALSAAGAPRREAPGGLRLAYIGAVIPQKGLDLLLRALALLPGRDLRLDVIGGFWGAAAYHGDVRRLAGADPRVTLVGALDGAEVFRALGQLDLLCLPSRVPETFSLVLHESAAAGVPAMVSGRGAPAQRVADLGCGRVIEQDDPRAWADAIEAVLQEPALLQRWRKALPLPMRVEEEAFFYESLYRRARRYPA